MEDICDAARSLGGPILIGHSMGGLLVLKAAELLSPLAVVAVTPASPRALRSLTSPSLLRAVLRHTPNIVLRRSIVPSRAEAVRLALNRLPAAEQERVYDKQVPESGRVALELGLLGLSVKPDALGCLRLMIAAGEDRLTPAASVRKLAARYRGEVREYAGFGHMIVLEPGWERAAEDVAGWLEVAVPGAGSSDL